MVKFARHYTFVYSIPEVDFILTEKIKVKLTVGN